MVSSFKMPHTKGKRQVELSVGGRALSKHCKRSCEGWWGDASGSAVVINWKAEVVLQRILHHAVWLNTHHLPGDLVAFEARTEEGYGVRWVLLKSGCCEFRGFLEVLSFFFCSICSTSTASRCGRSREWLDSLRSLRAFPQSL